MADKVAYRIVEVGASLRERRRGFAEPVARVGSGCGSDLRGSLCRHAAGGDGGERVPGRSAGSHLLDVSGGETREAYVSGADPILRRDGPSRG